jgi:FkbM family methyltransferase
MHSLKTPIRSASTSRYPAIFFVQFSFLTALRILIVEAVRKIFEPHADMCFAHAGEDKLIAALHPMPGVYVDVGCNSPTAWSNTMALYKRGWRGINIDANSEFIRQHKKIKVKDVSVVAAISKVPETLTFTQFVGSNGMSTCDAEFLQYRLEGGHKIASQSTVQTQTLTEVLDQLGAPRSFELLNVDVEGLDLQVLESLDFSKYCPHYIWVEIFALDLENPASSPVFCFLASVGYKLKAYTDMNALFIRKHPSQAADIAQ